MARKVINVVTRGGDSNIEDMLEYYDITGITIALAKNYVVAMSFYVKGSGIIAPSGAVLDAGGDANFVTAIGINTNATVILTDGETTVGAAIATTGVLLENLPKLTKAEFFTL